MNELELELRRYGMRKRVRELLSNAQICSVKQLSEQSEAQLLKLQGFGAKALKEVSDFLDENGGSLLDVRRGEPKMINLTKRELFAAMAMHAHIVANILIRENITGQNAAKGSMAAANALIEVLKDG